MFAEGFIEMATIFTAVFVFSLAMASAEILEWWPS